MGRLKLIGKSMRAAEVEALKEGVNNDNNHTNMKKQAEPIGQTVETLSKWSL